MAKVTLTFEDRGSKVHLQIESDPPFPMDEGVLKTSEATSAQAMALQAASAAMRLVADEDTELVDVEEAEA